MASTAVELLRRRFGGKKGILPQGYTQLNYIENTGNACIFITKTMPFKIELEFAPDLDFIISGYGCMFGFDSNFQAAFAGNGKANIGNAISSATFFSDNVRTNVKCYLSSVKTQTYYYVNDSDTGLTRASTTTSWVLFAATSSGSHPARGKMYSFKMWNDNNELIMNLIPCIDPNNIYGMYDVINDVFYSSNTSTPFIGG